MGQTQNNLAAAYRDRIKGSKADNVEAAIKAYEAALTVRTREAFPQDWARRRTISRPPTAIASRAPRPTMWKRRSRPMEAALTVRTREAFPQDWATTHNNLAAAYRDRIQGSKADNVEAAIKA